MFLKTGPQRDTERQAVPTDDHTSHTSQSQPCLVADGPRGQDYDGGVTAAGYHLRSPAVSTVAAPFLGTSMKSPHSEEVANREARTQLRHTSQPAGQPALRPADLGRDAVPGHKAHSSNGVTPEPGLLSRPHQQRCPGTADPAISAHDSSLRLARESPTWRTVGDAHQRGRAVACPWPLLLPGSQLPPPHAHGLFVALHLGPKRGPRATAPALCSQETRGRDHPASTRASQCAVSPC